MPPPPKAKEVRRPSEVRRRTHNFGEAPAAPAQPRGPPPRQPPPPQAKAVPAFPEPKHEPKGPLRKVNSLNEYKGQRASAAQHYSPIARPSAGGIQRVSLSAMAGNKNVKFMPPKNAAPPKLLAKAAPPRDAPKPTGARIHQHAPAAEKTLSPEWTQHWDEEVGSHYYFNSTTGEATWVQPT